MKTWIRQNYIVKEIEFDYDLHAFAVITDEGLVKKIYPTTYATMEQIISDLDAGADVNGWEDGNGNTITICDGPMSL